MPNINLLFPEVVFSEKLNLNKTELLNNYKQQNFVKYRGAGEANSFTEISENYNVLDEMPIIKNSILKGMNDFANNFLKYKNEFKITTSWFTKTEKNQFSIMHNHANSMFSAVYYFDNNLNSEIRFEKKSLSMFELAPYEHNDYNSGTITMSIENETLIIFPSYLPHQVMQHKDDSVRKSLAVNFLPVGVIGNGNGSASIV